MGLTDTQWTMINEIIKKIYLDDISQVLENVTHGLSKLINYSHSMYHYYKLSGKKTVALDYHSIDLSQEVLNAYIDKFENIDYIAWYSDIPISRAYRDTDLMDDESRETSELMTEWMQPNNMYFCLSSTVAHHKIAFAGLSFFKTREDGDFTDDEKRILSIINDHLSIKFFLSSVTAADTQDNSEHYFKKYKLSNKEMEILEEIKNGVLREDLPEKLCISENTLKKHLSHIYEKLQINRFEQLLQLLASKE